MADPRCRRCTIAVAVIALLSLPLALDARQAGGDKKPSLSLRATPPMGFSPLRVRLGVDVKGGSNDYADFYCASVEWDWGDGTMSENSSDCEPFEPGKSSIQRRFSAEHVYRGQGAYKVIFKLKQKDRVVGTASVTVQVRSGVGLEG
jgi:hypothetical protein